MSVAGESSNDNDDGFSKEAEDVTVNLLANDSQLPWPLSNGSIYNRDSLARVAAHAEGTGIPESELRKRPFYGAEIIGCQDQIHQSSLQIVRPLIQGGHWHNIHKARVWLCRPAHSPSHRLLLKLFTDVPHRQLIGQQAAESEAAAFERLERDQGHSLPYSYGFYYFEVPHALTPTTVGHVMEYIEGEASTEWASRMWKAKRIDAIDALRLQVFDSVIHFHRMGVFHGDPAPRNVIIQEGSQVEGGTSSQHAFPVFFDFEEAYLLRPTDVDNYKAGKHDKCRAFTSAAFRDCDGVDQFMMDGGFGRHPLDDGGPIETRYDKAIDVYAALDDLGSHVQQWRLPDIPKG